MSGAAALCRHPVGFSSSVLPQRLSRLPAHSRVLGCPVPSQVLTHSSATLVCDTARQCDCWHVFISRDDSCWSCSRVKASLSGAVPLITCSQVRGQFISKPQLSARGGAQCHDERDARRRLCGRLYGGTKPAFDQVDRFVVG